MTKLICIFKSLYFKCVAINNVTSFNRTLRTTAATAHTIIILYMGVAGRGAGADQHTTIYNYGHKFLYTSQNTFCNF